MFIPLRFGITRAVQPFVVLYRWGLPLLASASPRDETRLSPAAAGLFRASSSARCATDCGIVSVGLPGQRPGLLQEARAPHGGGPAAQEAGAALKGSVNHRAAKDLIVGPLSDGHPKRRDPRRGDPPGVLLLEVGTFRLREPFSDQEAPHGRKLWRALVGSRY